VQFSLSAEQDNLFKGRLWLWNLILLEKLNIHATDQKFRAFMEPEYFSPHLQAPDPSACCDPVEFTLHSHKIFYWRLLRYYRNVYV
jgi:hypothetical protein